LVTIFGYLADVAVTPEPLAPLFAEQLKTLPARLLSAVLRYAVSALPAGQHGLRSLPSEVIHAIDLLSRERSL
jgi:hypothetical protein